MQSNYSDVFRVLRNDSDGDSMNQFTECETFTGRMRQLCRNEASGIDVDGPNGINAYRISIGVGPLHAPVMPPVPPSLVIRGWNFAAAMARWTLAGMPRRTQEEIDERLAICQACDFLQNDHCTKCGCACVESNRLINKLSLSTENCPDGKWS